MGKYTDGRYGTRQTVAALVNSNKTANAICGQFKFFTDVLVREVRVNVVTAGTTHATHALKIYKAGSSIGIVTMGTQTSGVAVDASLTDTTFASTDALDVRSMNSDATFKGVVQVDYNEIFNNDNT